MKRPVDPRATIARPARQACFGRDAELALLARLDRLSDVDRAHASVRIVFVHGVSGIGKSALLGEAGARAEARGVSVTAIDLRELEPTRDAVEAALVRALTTGPRVRLKPRVPRARPKAVDAAHRSSRLTEVLARVRAPRLLLLDGYIGNEVLDRWMCDQLVPALPVTIGVALASRTAPSPVWVATSGWRQTIVPLPLDGLDADAAAALLAAAGTPLQLHREAVALTRGHPLALALVADLLARDPEQSIAFEHTPDLVRALAQRFVGGALASNERAALEVAAVVEETDEAMLAALVPEADAAALFDWLEAQSFIEAGVAGLRPFELVREVLVADLLRRAPERYALLVRRAVDTYVARFHHGIVDPDRVARAVFFIHRRQLAPSADWEATADLQAGIAIAPPAGAAHPANDTDLAAIRDMIRHHEGDEAVAHFMRWLELGLEVRLVRERSGRVVAFVAFLALDRMRLSDVRADPVTRVAGRVIGKLAKPGESVNLVRWWIGKDFYQAPTPEHAVLGALMMRKNFEPRLAWSLWPVVDEPEWLALCAAMPVERLPEADFDFGGRRHAMFVMDLARKPMALGLADFTRRTTAWPGTEPPPEEPTRVVLARDEIDAALRDALEQLHHPDALARSPLARLRVIDRDVHPSDAPEIRGAALKKLIEAEALALADTPKSAHCYAALRYAYLTPEVKRELAAKRAGVSYATLRRHLASAIGLLAARLWQRETIEAADRTDRHTGGA